MEDEALPGVGSEQETARLTRYAELLRTSPHNLLSPKGLAELEERHFPESVAFAASLPRGPRLLDIGSGGGLPGMVIAIARSDLEVHLLEATGKKVEFLAATAERLELSVGVHRGRAEELSGGALRGTFDLVTARAVAPLDRLAGLAAPYLRKGGQLHAIKGERWPQELEEARPGLDRLGLVVLTTPDQEGGAAGRGVGPMVVVLGRE
jgi:16S rRNA (guanine527-N7)-methyltransferase